MQEAFGAGAAPTRTGDNQTRAPLLQRGGTIGEPKLAYISNLYPKFFGAEFVDPGQCALSRRQMFTKYGPADSPESGVLQRGMSVPVCRTV